MKLKEVIEKVMVKECILLYLITPPQSYISYYIYLLIITCFITEIYNV